MKFNSMFDEPIRRLEKEFFSSAARRNDSRFAWPENQRSSFNSPILVARPDLLDKREYNELVESRVEDEEILKNSETELILRISCIDFKPEQITVTVEDNLLLIEGVQERLSENNKIRRQFLRKINLPTDSLTKEMNCTAKANGLLHIIIPRKPIKNKNEKIIPIRLETPSTNQALNLASNQELNQELNQASNQQSSQTASQTSTKELNQKSSS